MISSLANSIFAASLIPLAIKCIHDQSFATHCMFLIIFPVDPKFRRDLVSEDLGGISLSRGDSIF